MLSRFWNLSITSDPEIINILEKSGKCTRILSEDVVQSPLQRIITFLLRFTKHVVDDYIIIPLRNEDTVEKQKISERLVKRLSSYEINEIAKACINNVSEREMNNLLLKTERPLQQP